MPPATSSAAAPLATREGSRNGTANLDAKGVTACRILRPDSGYAPSSIPAPTYRSTLASPGDNERPALAARPSRPSSAEAPWRLRIDHI